MGRILKGKDIAVLFTVSATGPNSQQGAHARQELVQWRHNLGASGHKRLSSKSGKRSSRLFTLYCDPTEYMYSMHARASANLAS